MYSRGSVLPLFVEQIKNGKPITVTNTKMTRFLLPLPIAIDLVLYALNHANNGDFFVRKAPASTVGNVAESMLDIFNSKIKIKNVGIREGEKLHEILVTQEELMRAEDLLDFYRIKYLMHFDYNKYFSSGKENHIPEEGYTSKNTERLDLKQTKELILSLPEIKKILV